MRIGKIVESGEEYWMDEQFRNLLVFGILIILKSVNFSSCKIQEIS